MRDIAKASGCFWWFKSHNRGGRPKLASETTALIQQMARENHSGFRGSAFAVNS
jgi:hypothetical protein